MGRSSWMSSSSSSTLPLLQGQHSTAHGSQRNTGLEMHGAADHFSAARRHQGIWFACNNTHHDSIGAAQYSTTLPGKQQNTFPPSHSPGLKPAPDVPVKARCRSKVCDQCEVKPLVNVRQRQIAAHPHSSDRIDWQAENKLGQVGRLQENRPAEGESLHTIPTARNPSCRHYTPFSSPALTRCGGHLDGTAARQLWSASAPLQLHTGKESTETTLGSASVTLCDNRWLFTACSM